MTTRTRNTQKKLDPNLVDRFLDHRIWHFLKLAKSKGEDSALFHHPVGVQANANYDALFHLLSEMGMQVKPKRPDMGYGVGIGLVEITGVTKVKTVLF